MDRASVSKSGKAACARVGASSTALITGASSGIGAALARCFARGGHDLVLVARREDRLRALARALHDDHGVHVDVLPADLGRAGAAKTLAATLRRRRRTIDVLVNNAGVLEQAPFVELDAQRQLRLLDLNVTALTAMLTAFVPAMVERGLGRVLNVASVAAFLPVPGLAVYAASKAYVLSLSESLAEELRDTGVTVTALCPGITATAMLERAGREHARVARLPGFVVGDANEVAAEGYRACMAGEVIAVPGTLNLMTTLAGRTTPKWLLRRVAGMAGRRML